MLEKKTLAVNAVFSCGLFVRGSECLTCPRHVPSRFCPISTTGSEQVRGRGSDTLGARGGNGRNPTCIGGSRMESALRHDDIALLAPHPISGERLSFGRVCLRDTRYPSRTIH